MVSQQLIEKTLAYYERFKNESYVVKPSLPILYFGNIVDYMSSELKVITVGKNPSDNEFRLSKSKVFSFCRFPKWDEEKMNLLESLNSYFDERTSLQWFSCYEPILKGMNNSYYPGRSKNRALHTDICSPLATSPTWSRLQDDSKYELSAEGEEIWKLLIEELQPDIMLISVSQALFQKTIRSSGKKLLTFTYREDKSPRAKPYDVFIYDYILKNGKKIKIVYGEAAQKPFGTISDNQKRQIGEKCVQ
jgi:hypothetical protein